MHKREKMPDTHISIHSLRMEGDVPVAAAGGFGWLISIHSLRMEGDMSRLNRRLSLFSFQSTPSAWRETEISRNV